MINKRHLVLDELEARYVETVEPKSKPVKIIAIYRKPKSGSDHMNVFEGFSNDLDDKNKQKSFYGRPAL